MNSVPLQYLLQLRPDRIVPAFVLTLPARLERHQKSFANHLCLPYGVFDCLCNPGDAAAVHCPNQPAAAMIIIPAKMIAAPTSLTAPIPSPSHSQPASAPNTTVISRTAPA